MASKLKIRVNGLVHNVTASLDTPLLYVLHNELKLHGPRFGCGLAQCGACSVLLDGKEIRSCVTPVAAVSGKAITTLEGLPALYASVARHDGRRAGCAASVAAGVDRRAGAALRLLPERHDDPGRRSAGDGEAADRGADPHGDERPPVPLRHLSADPDRDPAGGEGDGEGREVTMTEILNKEFSRKSFVKGGGALVVGFSARRRRPRRQGARRPRARTRRTGPYDLQRRSTRGIAIHADNTVTLKLGPGRARPGHATGLLMIAAEELDMELSQMKFDHARHERDAGPGRHRRQPRRSRAAARRSARRPRPRGRRCSASPRRSSASPMASLTVANGVVSGGGRTVTYGAAARRQAVQRPRCRPRRRLDAGRSGADEAGQPVQARRHDACRAIDIPDKVTGKYTYVHNIRVPGMLHGRVVRPRGQGAYGDGTAPKIALGRRELDQAHPGRAGRPHERLPRRRRADGVRRDPGGGAAEGEVGRPAAARRASATCSRASGSALDTIPARYGSGPATSPAGTS